MKFELRPYTKSISEDEIINNFKKVANKLKKKSVAQREYVKHGKYSVKTVYAKFGLWKGILDAASLELSSNIGSVISEKDLFIDLEEVWIKLERQPIKNA